MKAVVLAIALAAASVGSLGVASAQAGPPGDARGYWQWIHDHSAPEKPDDCCETGITAGPSVSCDQLQPAHSLALCRVVGLRPSLYVP